MNYGIDIGQLRRLIVGPVLRHLRLWSQTAENLVVGTALVESGGRYLHQIRGPALSPWQMEPSTHNDHWWHFLRYHPLLAARVRELETPTKITEGADELIGNLYYGAAMCRVHYYRVRAALPANTPFGLAAYWKQWYNTPRGAGTVEKALLHFEVACQ